MTVLRPGLAPDHHVTVNLDDPAKPTVYVTATVTFP